MKKIAFVNGGLSGGGTERVISILARSLSSEKYNIDICLLLSNIIGYDIGEHTNVYDFTHNNRNKVIIPILWILNIRDYVRKNHPDLIIAWSGKEYLLCKVATIGMNVRIGVSERNDPRYDGRDVITWFARKFCYKKANCIIFQTQTAKSYFPKGIQDVGTIIPNPVFVSSISTLKKSNEIVSVGRLEPQKNRRMLINAFKNIHDKYPSYRLVIYGEGSLRDEIEKQIDSLELMDCVVLAGNVNDVHKRIIDAEMFVLSSDYEGLSNALLEAVCMGMPCISTDCAGANDCIENGISGIIVPINNAKAMEEAIEKYILDEPYRIKCAKAARDTYRLFSVDYVIKRWENTIDTILS